MRGPNLDSGYSERKNVEQDPAEDPVDGRTLCVFSFLKYSKAQDSDEVWMYYPRILTHVWRSYARRCAYKYKVMKKYTQGNCV